MSNSSLKGVQEIFFTTIGIVEDTNDPAQMGRLRIFCPSIDSENHKIDDLPWASYVTPFGGTIKNIKVGPEGDTVYGPSAYGMWSIPKQGATVVVQFLNGNTNYRIWTGCIYPAMSNRGLPAGRGYDITKTKPFPSGPFSDSYEDMQPAKRNLALAGLNTTHYFTRGGYERQIAQALTDKDGSDGYAKNPNKTDAKELDSQGYCLVTPGRHFISMQDAPDFCRVRVKTTTGHQLLLDDTNERIYLSTNKGNSWLEMDSDGHIHIYGSSSISYSTGGDFNVSAGGSINMAAGGALNLTGSGVNITSGADISLNSGCSTLITAGDAVEIGASANVNIKGVKINLNTNTPATAAIASKPGIVPTHEPFARPASAIARNSYWKA